MTKYIDGEAVLVRVELRRTESGGEEGVLRFDRRLGDALKTPGKAAVICCSAADARQIQADCGPDLTASRWRLTLERLD